MEYFSYKSEYGICVSNHLKEKLAWPIDKWYWLISNVILLKIVVTVKNKIVLSLKLHNML